MYKKSLLLAIFSILTLSLFSFHARSPEIEELVEENPSFKIALILPTTVKDYSLGQSIYESLMTLKQSAGLYRPFDVTVESKVISSARAEEKMITYAEEGYNLIIAHGFLYRDTVAKVAPLFPNVSFATFLKSEDRSPETLSNVFTYDVISEEAGYVNGVTGALVANFSNIGLITPSYDLHDDIKAYIVGFQNAVKATAPLTHILVAYTNSPWFPKYSSQAAGIMIIEQTRILSGIYPQAIGALGVAEQNNMLWLATEYDQSSLAPRNVLISMVYKWEDTLQNIISSCKDGIIGGENYTLDLANGGIKATFNEGCPIEPEIKVAIEKVILGIKKGYVNPLEDMQGS